MNCERRATIIDQPLEKTNDTKLGMIPFCCRNGTILPPAMDPSKSASAFQINVFKMPPDLNRSLFTPPQNWKIEGRLNPDYKCGPPFRVSPSQFPDPSDTAAFASWQVVCNITQPKGESPRCCVSFSVFFNESIIPCLTCSCGFPSNTARTCSTKSSSSLKIEPRCPLPGLILIIFQFRTHCHAEITAVSASTGIYSPSLTGMIQLDKAAPGFDAVYVVPSMELY
uniref:COBRA-like protein 7 n=1 Tax=Nicotiana tabacum TaxID=4097 RepID=A0A1S3XVA7_TOBAC|nr:PREDICTED: COBRA-like protein 7 [Nicotiana tabacum]